MFVDAKFVLEHFLFSLRLLSYSNLLLHLSLSIPELLFKNYLPSWGLAAYLAWS